MEKKAGWQRSLGLVLLVLGTMVYLLPFMDDRRLAYHTAQEIRKVEAMRQEAEQGEEELTAAEPEEAGSDPLRDAVEVYNRELYDGGQAGFNGDSVGSSSVFPDRLFGYIEIPAMEITLPLYLGATDQNMAEGAAVLGGTSLPVGGMNTNCVIAGHRGYGGAPFFRDIEELSPGDAVYIANRWENLCYRVEQIAILDPLDSEKVKICPGKDMVTLITCHPYRSHGKFRYAVYCVRAAETEEKTVEIPGITETQKAGEDLQESLSGRDIRREKRLRKFGAMGIALMILLLLAGEFCRRKGREE